MNLDARSAALFEAQFRIVTNRVVPFREDPKKAPRTEKRQDILERLLALNGARSAPLGSGPDRRV